MSEQEPKAPDFEKMGRELIEKMRDRKEVPLHCRRCRKEWKPETSPVEGQEPKPNWAGEDGFDWAICDPCGFEIAQEKSGIPERYRGARLKDLTKEARAFAERARKKGGYVWGTPGVGKSHLIAAVANVEIYESRSAVPFTDWDLLKARWESASRWSDGETREQLLKRLTNARIVFFDEFLSSKMTFSDQDERIEFKLFVTKLVDLFYSRNRIVLFGGNLPLRAVMENLDQKVRDRIFQMIGGSEGYYEMKGHNRRTEGTK